MTIDSKNYPPSVQRGYKPPTVRYVWYLRTGEGTDHCGMTLGGITNLTVRQGKVVESLRVMDMVRGKAYSITDCDRFIDLWSKHYLDPEWRIPQSVRE